MSDLICYCFGYDSNDIEQDFLSNGKSTIFERIMAEKQAGDANALTRTPKAADAYLMFAVVDKVTKQSNVIPIFNK